MNSLPIGLWVAIAVAAAVAMFVAVRRSSTKPGAAPPRSEGPRVVQAPRAANPAPHHWESTGDFAFSVVGESHYQAALKAIAGEHGKKKARVECVARLVPEDQNRHDNKAVAVSVDGAQVGNLRREDARSFRRRLGQKGLGGQATFCNAVVLGGGEWRGEARMYGIQLDLKPFDAP